MGAWLAVMVPLHLLLSALGKRDAIPPLFLAGTGRIAGLRIEMTGLPRAGAVLVANHVSWLDIFALAATSRAIFVAQEGLAGHRALKWLCDQNRTVFVARDNRGSVGSQVEQVRAALGNRPLAIFPEGTTSAGLLPFRSSLLAALEPLPDNISIQPVALAYEDAEEIAWTGGEPGVANARRILSRTRPVRLKVHFLEPLSGPALANRKTMTNAAREAIERTMAL